MGAHVCAGVQRPKVDTGTLSWLLALLFMRQALQESPELPDGFRLMALLALGVPCLQLLRDGVTGSLPCSRALGTQTPVLTFADCVATVLTTE